MQNYSHIHEMGTLVNFVLITMHRLVIHNHSNYTSYSQCTAMLWFCYLKKYVYLDVLNGEKC